MSLQVRKYTIVPGLPIPDGVAQWLGVGFQGGAPVVWAVAAPGEGPTWVQLVLTGDAPPTLGRNGMRPQHIGTAQLERDGEYFVAHLWHVWP